MKSQDIVILLKLVSLQERDEQGFPEPLDASRSREDAYSARGLEASLGISKSEVNASINRSLASGLAMKDREQRIKPNRSNLHNFIAYGLKFVFPAKPGAMTRGVPTAFAAPMLQNLLMSAGEYIYIWPYAHGVDMGQAVEPLFKSVPEAIQNDKRLYEYLALVDGIRLGKQREASLAIDRLAEKIQKR